MKNGFAFKTLSLLLAILLLFPHLFPTLAWGLAPRQAPGAYDLIDPEQLVDPFTGDFNYSIPLINLPGPNGGYNFNLQYRSGVGMNEEAGWVGLGWQLEAGSIQRQVKGLPDEFKGDVVTAKNDLKENYTAGINAGGGIEILGGSANVGVDLSLYYNNYRGFGYGFGSSIGLSPGGKGSPSIAGLKLGYDSQNGISGNLSLGVNVQSASFSFNSEAGPRFGALGYSSNYARYFHTPKVGLEFRTIPLSVLMKLGAIPVAHINAYVGGFYNLQKLKTTDYSRPAYGYFHLEHAGKTDGSLMDFNREKEGPISLHTHNLPVPILTADDYHVSSALMGGKFRAYRHDWGSVYDPYAESSVIGGSVGLDLPTDLQHFGLNFSIAHGTSESGGWFENNVVADTLKFRESDEFFHNFHLRFEDDQAPQVNLLPFIGRADAMQPQANHSGRRSSITSYNSKNSKANLLAGIPYNAASAAQVGIWQFPTMTNRSILPMPNSMLLKGSTELLPEYIVRYYGSSASVLTSPTKLTRTASHYKPHHPAGMAILNENGVKSVFGLPVIKKEEVHALFSVNNSATNCATYTGVSGSGTPDYKHSGTDEFIDRKVIPAHAESYLLTSVLGPDYADVNANGPDTNDIGYWVNFNYRKIHDNFQERAPHNNAFYDMGAKGKFGDNKGYYTYSKKEVWYLAKAETRSHVAVFWTSTRNDAQEANGEINTSGSGSGRLHKLDSIKLFTRSEYHQAVTQGNFNSATPLKTVTFTYDYSLCNGAPNASTGKLTLKQVAIHYQNNERGKSTPYVFTYGTNNSYSAYQVDRWGSYASHPDQCAAKNLPYTSQFNAAVSQSQSAKTTFKNALDQNSRTWLLDGITTPTGASITVQYESDDYGYVQHRRATQMVPIDRLALGGSNDELYDDSFVESEARIYFTLEHPIPTSVGTAAANQQVYDDYLEGLVRNDGSGDYIQIYFKALANLRDNINDYVTGYANLPATGGYGIDATQTANIDIDGTSPQACYTTGYIELKPVRDNGKKYHPIAAAAWEELLTTYPELLTTSGTLDQPAGSSDMDKAVKVKSLINFIPVIKKLSKGYREHAKDEGWGKRLNLSRSVIRLCSPDRIKYGGGVRVREITVSDGFTANGSAATYGKKFRYTTTDTDGKEISSGVAAYEPALGGDENPLRYAKLFKEDFAYNAPIEATYEYPLNESYYPTPSVGYSKVEVITINSDQILEGTRSAQVGSTGLNEYEFYTARDFPTLFDRTPVDNRKFELRIPLPLVGGISEENATATQGFSVYQNDMHGKPKSQSYYDIVAATPGTAPISRVEYHYDVERLQWDGKEAYRTVPRSNYENFYHQDIDYGLTSELFADHNRSYSYQANSGGNANVDIAWIIPLPSYWPSFSKSSTSLHTTTFNKVTRKNGQLQKVIYTDGLSTSEEVFLAKEAATGIPAITGKVNAYGDTLYSSQSFVRGGMSYQVAANSTGQSSSDDQQVSHLPSLPHLFSEREQKRYVHRFTAPDFSSVNFLHQLQVDLKRLDTNGLETELSTTLRFQDFINQDYANFYSFQVTSSTTNLITPGCRLRISNGSGTYEGIIINIGDQENASALFGGGRNPVWAIYSQDLPNITSNTAFTVTILDPGAKNILNTSYESIAALTYPDPLNNPDIDTTMVYPSGQVHKVNYLTDVVHSQVQTYQEAWPRGDNHTYTSANPYTSGEMGALRASGAWTYQTLRNNSTTPDLRNEGKLLNSAGQNRYYMFGQNDVAQLVIDRNRTANAAYDYVSAPEWKRDEAYLQYDKNSNPIEMVDALGVHSAASYGYFHTLKEWEARNTKHTQAFYYSFDDDSKTFRTKAGTVITPSSTHAHSGNHALQVSTNTEYQLPLRVTNGEEYLVSTWIRIGETTFDYGQTSGLSANTRGLEVLFYNSDYSTSYGTSVLLKPTGPIIEGWQKVEGVVSMTPTNPVNTIEKVTLRVKPGTISGSTATLWLDDLRIHPRQALMISYSYDPETYRLQSTLDENNYATYHFYDEEGQLFLTKRETEKGVFTIQESRYHK